MYVYRGHRTIWGKSLLIPVLTWLLDCLINSGASNAVSKAVCLGTTKVEAVFWGWGWE